MKTQIVATAGPASITHLPSMVKAGMNVLRINSSHGDPAFHIRALASIREFPGIAVIYDIKGPKIRIGDIPEPLPIRSGMQIVLRTDLPAPPGSDYPAVTDFSEGLPVSEPALADKIKPGDRLLIDDGYVGLVVTRVQPGRITCRVQYGDRIRSRKGLNHPDTIVDFPYTMPHDIPLIAFAVDHRVDYIADSFTRNREDVLELRSRLKGTGIRIVSKIENPEAVDAFDDILDVTDAVMIARGDLGVEMAPWLIPELQKQMTEKCNRAGKPVIIATQMLESMIDNPHPSRADVSDIANAIYDGADAVMLSAETSVGSYPAACVEMMRRIATEVEKTERYRERKSHIVPLTVNS